MKRIMLVITTVLVLASCESSHVACDAYGVNSIYNPENAEFVVETAFNAKCTVKQVTQEMFDERYSSGY